MRRLVAIALCVGLTSGCTEPSSQREESKAVINGSPPEMSGKRSETGAPAERKAYFGDLHVHTRFSYDAFVFGTRTDPDAAFEFAKGNPIRHPAGFELELDRPLDFQAVTDHATYLGMLQAMLDPKSPAYDHPAAETVREARTPAERQGIFSALQPYVRFVQDADPRVRDQRDMGVIRSAWAEVVAAANRHNDPGTFTAFIGYEYTSAGAGGIYNNLHRNVVFRGADAPDVPFSRLESYNPEDLWSRMDEWRSQGMDALAIPHNSNGSGGRMFEFEYFDGRPIDDAYVSLRMRNEPLVEVTQTKGTSETHPALSPNDEWAAFEIMPYRISTSILSEPPGSYVRDALRRGLEIEAGGTENPYRFGVIGSSDTHVSAGSFEEKGFWGASGLLQATAAQRGSVPLDESDDSMRDSQTVDDGSGRRYSGTTAITSGASGLAGVWAEENSRGSLFDAMRRRETFATSGPRLRVRFFAGADLSELELDDPALIAKAYERGVPMGGELRRTGSGVPHFLAWATRDPLGAPLQRLQVIKGWLGADGRTREQVYDVACSEGLAVDAASRRCPDNGARVDLDTCEMSRGIGAEELRVNWSDPDFDPAQRAFYYLRVLENPSCRWSTWDAVQAGARPREDMPAVIQERAWSAPIWYGP